MNSKAEELWARAKRELDAAETIVVRPSMVDPQAVSIRADAGFNVVYEYAYSKDRRYQVVIHDRVVYDTDLFGEPDE